MRVGHQAKGQAPKGLAARVKVAATISAVEIWSVELLGDGAERAHFIQEEIEGVERPAQEAGDHRAPLPPVQFPERLGHGPSPARLQAFRREGRGPSRCPDRARGRMSRRVSR